tara:strand:- start:1015 stop:1266 length:252 start_codon:yes stop_codon:yes gene_type:complete
MSKEKINKVSEEELVKIKEHAGKLQQHLLDLGSLDIRKQESLQMYKIDLDAMEVLKKELEEAYGQVNINLTDGTYEEIEKTEE